MVLPLLGSFLGSAILPGMFGGSLGTVAAGAIGSGLGSLLQGDSFDEAIGTGLTSFMGGKLLGGLGKTPEIAKGEGLAGMLNPKLASQSGVAPALLKEEGLKGILSKGLDIAKANPLTTAGIAGGAMLANAANQQGTEQVKTPFKPSETVPIQQNIAQPMPGYRAGVDPEFNYGFRNPSAGELQTRFLNQGGMADYVNPTMLSKGGIATFAEGGDVVEAEQSQMSMLDANEKDIIINAVNAIKGNMPEREASIALAMFVEKFGEEALEDLVEDVKKGEYDNISGKADGMIKGGGDGMSDSVPATIDGKQDLLVSKDEYVVDAPTVAMIGNGSSAAGAEKLDKMREEVRKAATGSRIQPKEIDAEEIMGKAIA